MKKSQQYLYLVIILLLGLLLAGFIKPFMEGFKEGAASCGEGFKYSSKHKMCVVKTTLPTPPFGISESKYKCKLYNGKLICGYKHNK